MSRRQPVYIVIDVAKENAKDCARQVQHGISCAIRPMRQDPYALELNYLSFISFDDGAPVVFPLTVLTKVECPTIKLGGSPGLAAAIKAAKEAIEADRQDGDYWPHIFLLTDGANLSDPDGVLSFEPESTLGKTTIWTMPLGNFISSPDLARISCRVVHAADCDAHTWLKCFTITS